MNDRVAKIRLRYDAVIVKPIEEKEINGILLPQNLQEAGQVGEVVNVGPGIKGYPGLDDKEMEIWRGDKVFTCKWAGSEIQIDGEKYGIMRQEDILARFHGDRRIDLTPLEDRVFIEWETGQNEYEGTKILRAEGSSKERYYTGMVISVGPKVKDLVAGDRVFFDQFCGPERIDFEYKRYALIWEKDIYCTLPLREGVMVLSH